LKVCSGNVLPLCPLQRGIVEFAYSPERDNGQFKERALQEDFLMMLIV